MLMHKKRSGCLLVALAAVLIVGCDSGGTSETVDYSATYTVPLSPPPGVQSNADGEAVLTVNQEGTAITYSLAVSNIDSVFVAHIHASSGQPVAFLFEAEDPVTVEEQTEIASGTITEADLVGPLEGQALLQLVTALADGGPYVNVHTTAYPGGEIQGTIGGGGSNDGNDDDPPDDDPRY